MKKFVITLLILSAFLIGISLFYPDSPRIITGFALSRILGVKVTIGRVIPDIEENRLRIEDMRIYNPEGFDRSRVMMYMPSVDVKYFFSFEKPDQFYIEELRIKLETISVVKNKEKILNVDRLNLTGGHRMRIDKMVLSMNKVAYTDYTRGDKPDVEIYAVSIKEKTYKNLPTVEEVILKILFDALSETAIKGAAVYGIATVAGVSLAGPLALPIGAVVMLGGKDSYRATLNEGAGKVFEAALTVAKEMGGSIYSNKKSGVIRVNINDANVKMEITGKGDNKTEVVVSARRYLIPQKRLAGGVLYNISQELLE